MTDTTMAEENKTDAIPIDDFLEKTRQRKIALGIEDDDASLDALRNKGGRRTPEKRALLDAIRQRSLAAGLDPLKAYY